MDRQIPPIIEVLAGFRRPDISLQITRSLRRDPHDHEIPPTGSYCLILCVTPRPTDTRACYPDVWGPARLEPLGDLSLMPPEHRLRIHSNRQRQVAITCHLSRKMVEQWLEHEIEWTDPRLQASLHLINPHVRVLMLRMAEEAHRPGIAHDAIIRAIASQLGVEIARFCESFLEVRAVGGLAGWRLRLIDERLRDLTKVPTVEDLAKLCNLSVRQLSRGFRVSRGCSISDYCSTHRIELAKRLLAGDSSIKAVAFSTGFASPSTFAQSFRLATGSTPREFRQRMCLAINPLASPTTILPD
jgi:AraC family transcriptional regulator